MLHSTEGEFSGSVSVSIILASTWCSLSQKTCLLTHMPLLYSSVQLCGLNSYCVLRFVHGRTSPDGELCLEKVPNITAPSLKTGKKSLSLVKRHISRKCPMLFLLQEAMFQLMTNNKRNFKVCYSNVHLSPAFWHPNPLFLSFRNKHEYEPYTFGKRNLFQSSFISLSLFLLLTSP